LKPQEPDIMRRSGDNQDDPLEQISQEHLRQREVCAILDKLATLKRPDPKLAAAVLPHFDILLPRHLKDEKEGLFPLLRRRSEPGDDINDTLDRLERNQSTSLELAVRVREIVQALTQENALPDAEQTTTLRRFAAHERRHLIVENAIVLPLARARLTVDDIEELRKI
jgi:hemerythrin-like domain-containing protein